MKDHSVNLGAVEHTRKLDIRGNQEASGHYSIRGELVDERHWDEKSECVHRMIVSLRIDLKTHTVVAAEFQLPRPAFPGLCEPAEQGASQMVGLSVSKGFLQSILKIYGRTNGCTHIVALLSAMVPSIQQGVGFVVQFPRIEALPPEHPERLESMQKIAQFAKGSCHVWAEDGEVLEKMESGQTDVLFERIKRN